MKAWPKVYILVLNWNGWRDTIECLESLLKLEYPNYQIVIIDNGSTDESVSQLSLWKERHPEVVLLETGNNLGYAGGNNFGLRYVLEKGDFDYVWILNNDTVVETKALFYLVQRMQEEPKAGICGSAVLHYERRDVIWALGGIYDKWFAQAFHLMGDQKYDPDYLEKNLTKIEKKMSYVVGASVLVSRKFLEEVGLMAEDYFLFFEEIDWATRARRKFSLILAPRSVVYHKGGASLKRREGKQNGRFSLVFDQYTTRNRLRFTLKFYPYLLPILYLSILGYIIDRIRCGAWENVAVIWKETTNHFAYLFKKLLKVFPGFEFF